MPTKNSSSFFISMRKKPINLYDKIECFALSFREEESSEERVILKFDVEDGDKKTGQITLILSKADFTDIILCAEFINKKRPKYW